MYVSCIARSESGNVLNILLVFFFFFLGGGCEFYYSVYKDYEEIALLHIQILGTSSFRSDRGSLLQLHKFREIVLSPNKADKKHPKGLPSLCLQGRVCIDIRQRQRYLTPESC